MTHDVNLFLNKTRSQHVTKDWTIQNNLSWMAFMNYLQESYNIHDKTNCQISHIFTICLIKKMYKVRKLQWPTRPCTKLFSMVLFLPYVRTIASALLGQKKIDTDIHLRNWHVPCNVEYNIHSSNLRNNLFNKTGVINDLLGQTHSLASSEHCFLLFCFSRFEKWGRTDNMCENNDPYRPWLWVGRVDQFMK